jgi:hypothetical protein
VTVVRFQAGDKGVLGALGHTPPALIGAIGRRFRDFADHHKKSVLKRARGDFASRDRAVRMLASRLFGYSTSRGAERLGQVRGESFLAAREDNAGHPLGREYFLSLEEGRSISTSDPMIIPTEAGLPYSGVFKNTPVWARVNGGEGSLLSRGFSFAPSANGRTLLVDERERTLARAAREGQSGGVVVGVLSRRRRQRQRLHFHDEADRVAPKHLARIEKDVELALTVAGRASLLRQNQAAEAGTAAWHRAYRQALDANPGKHAAARRAATEASRLVSRRALAPRGRA